MSFETQRNSGFRRIRGWAASGFFGGFSADITLKGGPMA
jgi:hypothetical protein